MHSTFRSNQDTYEYIDLNSDKLTSETATGGNTSAAGARQQPLSGDMNTAVYNNSNGAASCDYSLETPVAPSSEANPEHSAAESTDVHAAGHSGVQTGDNTLHDVNQSGGDVTKLDEDENIYFKDNDAYEQ